jgi:hypothetical protein
MDLRKLNSYRIEYCRQRFQIKAFNDNELKLISTFDAYLNSIKNCKAFRRLRRDPFRYSIGPWRGN